jgi:hypothetical protein
MSKPRDEPQVTTYFELQRNRDGLPEPGEEKPAPVMPPLPSTSPWHHDPVPDEPTIEGDSNTMDIPIDQLNR